MLVRGFGGCIGVWREQIRDLSGRFRVIAYYQRGHGASGVPSLLERPAQVSDAIRSLVSIAYGY
ncbi:alpha/beta fold hydrolase [Mycobacterium sp. 94-17]|uniref:alpha/beta fold hydrolase n=1 Tax=Mycobacterium sp. 94-17 TaxID=2986147 RepID=UPI002D1EEA51|nr:alpha/beta fold hydrolase [Mycobacterium sp. 94-17]MEB4209782.1 hypothetical protein [Mycobacterium sp. 94-17]